MTLLGQAIYAQQLLLTGACLLAAFMIFTHHARAQSGDKAYGEYLSSECVTCHQLSGNFSGISPIVGWPEESFIEVLNTYREKKRDNEVMQTIAARLSDKDIAALAAYFGSLKPMENK